VYGNKRVAATASVVETLMIINSHFEYDQEVYSLKKGNVRIYSVQGMLG
jgi:hypothetical protein